MINDLIKARDRFADAYPEQRIILNGRDWGFIDAGSGPTLILIPGTLGRSDIFWQQIEALKNRVRIIATSYPATGGVADWADDIVALMDACGVEKATILGSSLGGFLAQYIAGKHSSRLDKLVAANTLHSVDGLRHRPPYSSDLETGDIEELRAGFGTGLEAWRQLHPDQANLVDLLLNEVGGRIPESELRRRLIALKTGPALPEPQIPKDRIVTVEATDDPLIPPEMRMAVRARLDPSVAYVFDGGGHFPYAARPDAYTALLEQVMDLEGSGGPEWGAEKERVL